MSQLNVILNPAARGGRGGKIRPRVEAALRSRGIDFELVPTQGPGHAFEVAQKLSGRGGDRLLVVGGDGTIHEVVNGLLQTDGPSPALAVLPVGTGNDFFRMIGSPPDLPSVLDLLEDGIERKMDVGRVRYGGREARFVNLLGIGLDVEVLKHRSGFSIFSGLPQYMAGLLAALVRFRSFPIQVDILDPNETISGPTLLSGVTVGPSIGGGFHICPEASPFDGLLDLFFVEPLGLGSILRYIPRVLRGTHSNIPEFHSRKVRQIRIFRPGGEPFFFEMDGELMPTPVTALDIDVCTEALPVLVPKAPS